MESYSQPQGRRLLVSQHTLTHVVRNEIKKPTFGVSTCLRQIGGMRF